MRATGIIRRIDDLGRVVIPREIRRTCGIREGEPLEIYVDTFDGRPIICFHKYQTNMQDEVRTMEGVIVDDFMRNINNTDEQRMMANEVQMLFRKIGELVGKFEKSIEEEEEE